MKEIKVYFLWLNKMRFVKENSGSGFNLLRQSPNFSGCWKNIQMVDDPKEADYFISIDNAWFQNNQGIKLKDIIFVARECKKTRFSLWEKSKNIPNNNLFLMKNNIVSPTLWFIEKSYDILMKEDFPKKSKNISCVTSDLNKRPGHKTRRNFLDNLIEKNFEFDLFGKIKNNNQLWKRFKNYKGEIGNKSIGLNDYKYTIAMENFKQENYFTEKIVDAYLSGCFPIYYGCSNIDNFFPKKSYFLLDFEKYSIKENKIKIRELIKNNTREKNIKALKEAKHLCLNEYQFWPMIKKVIDIKEGEKNVSNTK